MTTVRGVRGEGLAARGGRDIASDDRTDRLSEALANVFPPAGSDGTQSPLRTADRVAIVPDAHYPFHPSTGMVTDPTVVRALAAHLESRFDADVAVVASSTEYADVDRCGRYLGYPAALSDLDATWTPLDDESTVRRTASVDGESIPVLLPERVAERTVVPVPSLRPTSEGTVAGAMRTLARHVSCDAPAPTRTVATLRAVEPVASLLDATTAYAGDPYAANALLAGDPVALDAAGAAALGRDPDADEAIARAIDDRRLEVSVSGLDFERLRTDLPSGALPPSSEPNPLVTRAYRLYATVSGDAVPPQLEGEP